MRVTTPRPLTLPLTTCLASWLVACLCACSMGVELPLSFEIDSERLDVDVERTALELDICATPSADCELLHELDRGDDGEVGKAPSLPQLLPRLTRQQVDVAGWLEQMRARHELLPTRTLAIETPQELLDGVAGELDRLVVGGATLTFTDSSLSFDIPALDLRLDGALIARSDAHPAATDGSVALNLAEGANDRLRAALATGAAELTLAPVDGSTLGLQERGDELVRPGGAADISLVLDLVVPPSTKLAQSL